MFMYKFSLATGFLLAASFQIHSDSFIKLFGESSSESFKTRRSLRQFPLLGHPLYNAKFYSNVRAFTSAVFSPSFDFSSVHGNARTTALVWTDYTESLGSLTPEMFRSVCSLVSKFQSKKFIAVVLVFKNAGVMTTFEENIASDEMVPLINAKSCQGEGRAVVSIPVYGVCDGEGSENNENDKVRLYEEENPEPKYKHAHIFHEFSAREGQGQDQEQEMPSLEVRMLMMVFLKQDFALARQLVQLYGRVGKVADLGVRPRVQAPAQDKEGSFARNYCLAGGALCNKMYLPRVSRNELVAVDVFDQALEKKIAPAVLERLLNRLSKCLRSERFEQCVVKEKYRKLFRNLDFARLGREDPGPVLEAQPIRNAVLLDGEKVALKKTCSDIDCQVGYAVAKALERAGTGARELRSEMFLSVCPSGLDRNHCGLCGASNVVCSQAFDSDEHSNVALLKYVLLAAAVAVVMVLVYHCLSNRKLKNQQARKDLVNISDIFFI